MKFLIIIGLIIILILSILMVLFAVIEEADKDERRFYDYPDEVDE